MTIIHKLEGFLFELFPKAKGANNSLDVLKNELERYYTYGPYKPTVTIEDEWVKVDIGSHTWNKIHYL